MDGRITRRQSFGKSESSPGFPAGKKSGCRFCLANDYGPPKIGERIRVLSDYMAGKTGTVVPSPPELSLKPEIIIVQMDDEPPEIQTMVNREHYLTELLPGAPVPEWEPPIPMRDLAELDKIVVRFCEESIWGRRKEPDWLLFYNLIGYVWYKRLPLEPDEIGAILYAHGVPENWRKRLISLFRHGRELLVSVVGRKPIKKKRLK